MQWSVAIEYRTWVCGCAQVTAHRPARPATRAGALQRARKARAWPRSGARTSGALRSSKGTARMGRRARRSRATAATGTGTWPRTGRRARAGLRARRARPAPRGTCTPGRRARGRRPRRGPDQRRRGRRARRRRGLTTARATAPATAVDMEL